MNSYKEIDLDKVKENVCKHATIEDSRFFIMNEEIPFNPIVIKRNLNETNEILKLIKKDIYISFDGIENINDILLKAKKESPLNSIEVSKVLNFHNHCKRIKDILNSIDEELLIKDYSDSININNDLANEISKNVDNSGNVKDDASIKLKEIIDSISINEKNLIDSAHSFINKHQSSLQEPTTYYRNNRLTFLIKNSDKNKFNGYTYGSSASGLASYVEPEILVNLNNNRISFEQDKQEEINRLLLNLTYLIGEHSDEYINNFDSIVKLNVSYAKAMYGFKNNAVIGELDNDELIIKDLCHPLIDSNAVISNTYRLVSPYKGIVISGTNTGGKTVGLKAIGLTVVMTYLGIPVIASYAKVPLYDNVYVDIDDNQSISNSLSTFSAHISNINTILNNATSKSLILIDELISGTDPKQAQAISLAILNKIENIKSSFVVTTHYDDIKKYAYDNDNIMLSSVGFDNDKLVPTYKYIENSVGSSNALEIASRYFDDKSIIDYASSLIKRMNSEKDELMNKLSKQIEENEHLKDDLFKSIKDYEELNQQLNIKYKEFDEEKIVLKKKYEDELNNYLNKIKEEAIIKLESINDNKQRDIIKEIDSLKINDDYKETFELNDNVKVGEGDRIGTITYINKDKVEVNINGIVVKTSIDNLTKMPKFNTKKQYIEKNKISREIKHELVVVGKHIDEALDEIEVFLDNALSNNLSQVKIIHGIGTGQLKNAIRVRLKSLKFVKSFSDGDFHDGGSAVTMVKLK